MTGPLIYYIIYIYIIKSIQIIENSGNTNNLRHPTPKLPIVENETGIEELNVDVTVRCLWDVVITDL